MVKKYQKDISRDKRNENSILLGELGIEQQNQYIVINRNNTKLRVNLADFIKNHEVVTCNGEDVVHVHLDIQSKNNLFCAYMRSTKAGAHSSYKGKEGDWHIRFNIPRSFNLDRYDNNRRVISV
jgi:hypothetical protein